MALNGYHYFFKTKKFADRKFSDKKQIGLIAQEVELIYPELVATDTKGYKSVNYVKLVPVLIEAIKEQHQFIAQQQTQINTEKAQLEQVSKRLKEMETLLQGLVASQSERAQK